MPENLSTGESIKRARQLKRMTQADLAEIMGVSQVSVTRWEADLQFPARRKYLLEEVLGITISEPAQAAS